MHLYAEAITVNQMYRKCSVCEILKTHDSFYKDKSGRDGIGYCCKDCAKEKARLWRESNPQRSKESIKKSEKKNPQKGRERSRRYLMKHPERRRAAIKSWKTRHPEKVREANRRHDRKTRGTIKGDLNNRMAVMIWYGLRGNKNNRAWMSLVGYTVDELIAHLEKLFLRGMSWENRSKWHIDHIMPIDSFSFNSAEDDGFKKCWALENLQPLWKEDNLKKSNKILNTI